MKMASNTTLYNDLTPANKLDKKTLNNMVWRSLFLQASFNYERMQAAGWLYGILPGLEKIHTNKIKEKSLAHLFKGGRSPEGGAICSLLPQW